jgi:hypothetical protein
MTYMLTTGLIALLSCALAARSTWYVDGSATASGDGKSWEAAFKKIQEGVDAATNGDTVIVGVGVYVERVYLRGRNIVLTSTNPLDPDVVAHTVIDGGDGGPVVAFAGTEDETCVLSGFTIQNGSSFSPGAGIAGGCADYHAHGTIENNVVRNNVVVAEWEAGGGIAFCDGIIRNNAIMNNSGRGTEWGNGGGLFDCDGTIEGNVIAGNQATWEHWTTTSHARGGGLYCCDGTIRNNIIWRNSAGSEGGGLCGCDGVIQNNTIVANSAGSDGGGFHSCNGTIRNCIVWGNRAFGGPQLFESATPTYSCVEGWPAGGEGIIAQQPRFVDAGNGDFTLLPGSPCIDSGLNSPELPQNDIAGMPRTMYGGKSLTLDMGAYEFFYSGVQSGPGPDEATLVWSLVPDKTYSIFYTDDLLTWYLAIEAVPSSGEGVASWTDDGSVTGAPPSVARIRFYRLRDNR